MKPPIEFRPTPYLGRKAHKEAQKVLNEIAAGRAETINEAVEALAHKRGLKAAQMRRYRAKKAGK